MLTGQESIQQGMSNTTIQAQKLLPDFSAQ
jgi:arabinogalactan oligomer/maltooligosaccharide transport system substrate-binding protein